MMRLRDKTEKIEELALLFFLLVCAGMSFFKDFLPSVVNDGLTAAIFLATFFILRQLRDLRLELQGARTREVFFATNEKFYSSAREAVRRANDEVRVTYFRNAPPSTVASSESGEYFAEVRRFAQRKGTVRRIIGVANKELADWCAAEAEHVRKNPRYHARVIVTKNQAVEPMSACIIDDDVMYMAFSGPTHQQLGGIREDAPGLVHFHQNRFDQLWATGTDLLEFIRSPDCRAYYDR
jgi:hypothetical protein